LPRTLQRQLGQMDTDALLEELLLQIQRLFPVTLFAEPSITVNANQPILPQNLTPNYTPCTLRVYVAFSAGGTLSVLRYTTSQTPTSTELNIANGPNLTANGEYGFKIAVDKGEAINFQYSTSATALKFSVEEMDATFG